MTVKIENIDLVCPAEGEVTLVKLESDLVNRAFGFFLSDIKQGDEIIVEFDKPKQMLPSFDKMKSDSVLILQYSNAEQDVPATVALIMELDISKQEIKMTGYGFTSATLSIDSEAPGSEGSEELAIVTGPVTENE